MTRRSFTDQKMHALGACVLGVVLTGCGLKGQLTLPEKSDGVIIRGPQDATVPAVPGSVPTEAGATTTPVPPAGTSAPATTPARAKPVDEPQPPPALPGGNPGTLRGG